MYDFYFHFLFPFYVEKHKFIFLKSFPILIIQLLENRSDSKSTLICTGFSAFYIWRIRVTVGSKSENRANNFFFREINFQEFFLWKWFHFSSDFISPCNTTTFILKNTTALTSKHLYNLHYRKKMRFFDLVPQILGKYRI